MKTSKCIWRRGSISVFMVVVFACFITVTAVLFAGAKASAGRSIADASLQLAGRSVLSEYDTRLLSDYGLLAFRGDEARIEDQIGYFTEASLAPNDPMYAVFRGTKEHTVTQDERLRDLKVNLKEYSLMDLDNFEDQIRTAAISRGLNSFLSGDGKGIGGSAKNAADNEHGYGRVLRNTSVISALPSNGFKGPVFPSFGDLSDIPKIENVMHAGTSVFLISEYALSLFGNHVDGTKENHFFGNEIEYLIAGKFDDTSNYNNIKYRLIAMRLILNNIALSNDPDKMLRVEGIALAVAAISGETFFEPTKVAVMEAWVAAETGNDLMLLEKGDKVAVFKGPNQWATQNILEIWAGWTSSEPAYANNRDGQTYRDYLRIMLYLLDRETKLLRIMDLMQLNLKGSYDGDFLMREHYIGFRFECRVDGDYYAYIEKY